MTSLEAALNSPNAGIQNQMQQEGSLKSTFEAFFKAATGNIIDPNTTIQKNMQNSSS